MNTHPNGMSLLPMESPQSLLSTYANIIPPPLIFIILKPCYIMKHDYMLCCATKTITLSFYSHSPYSSLCSLVSITNTLACITNMKHQTH